MERPAAPALAPEEVARSRRIVDRVAAEGRGVEVLPFDRYVEIALYDPEDGYYAQPLLRLGRAGDYYTATHVHPLFGRSVAARVLSEYDRLGRPPDFRIVEAGAGDGTLAVDLRAALRDAGAELALARHALIELPGPRRERLADRFAGLPGPGEPPELADAVAELGSFSGVVVANELLDALPFRRLVRRDGAWRELGVTVGHGRVRWAEGPLARPVPSPALPDAPDGTVLEVGEAAEAWVREVADFLVDGLLLLLDYGREEAELARGFPHGTLAAARSHVAGLDPLAHPGTADLSAFVNFTRLRAAAERAGLAVLADRPQAEALGAWGFERLRDRAIAAAEGPEGAVRVRLAAKNLLFGFEGFRALELSPRPAPNDSGRRKSA